MEHPCSSYSWTHLTHSLSMDCQQWARGDDSWKGNIGLSWNIAVFSIFIWCAHLLGFFPFFRDPLHWANRYLYVHFLPCASRLCKILFLFSFLRENKVLGNLICTVQLIQAIAAHWNEMLFTFISLKAYRFFLELLKKTLNSGDFLKIKLKKHFIWT